MRYLLLLALVLGCPDTSDDDDSVEDDDDATSDDDDAGPAPMRPPGCEDAFKDPTASQLIEGLDAVGALEEEVWPGHRPQDGAVVLYEVHPAGHCALLHRAEIVDYALLAPEPALLTPAFGYQLPWTTGPDWVAPLGAASQQPADWVDWLADHDVDRAAILPVFPEGLPVGLSSLSHQQLAVHEAFHVTVQAGAWFGEPSHPWPAWDEQPNRAELAACYADAGVQQEQSSLRDAVAAARAGDWDAGCMAYRSFQLTRIARRPGGLLVTAADGQTQIGCSTAEAILELEEGIAEYAGWSPLLDAGLANEAQLSATLGASTDEPFYKFGAGQLLFARAGDPEAFGALLQAIADSTDQSWGVEAGVAAFVDAQGICP
jgi:hypothetical protein